MKTPIERVLNRIEMLPESGCWIFMGVLSEGYGAISLAHGLSPERVHRVVYKHFVGVIPIGFDVCHKCDIRSCCNPNHLFLGTRKQNMQDAVSKGRHAHGKKFLHSKLSDEIVLWMRDSHAAGFSGSRLALEVDVSITTANKAISGRTWKHV